MRSPAIMAFLMLLIAPALAGAQDRTDTTHAAAPPGSAPAPADVQARAPAKAEAVKSRNFFGQAIAELTRSVEASRSATGKAATPHAQRPAPAPTSPPRDTQVAAQDPVD